MEEVFFYHLDHLGTPLAMTRENKSVCWSSEYLPFGQVFNEEVSETNELRFPGQYHDQETDRYYNWHRYYDPETGRYMQSDPTGLIGGINPFSYARQNPLSFVDPLGLNACYDFVNSMLQDWKSSKSLAHLGHKFLFRVLPGNTMDVRHVIGRDDLSGFKQELILGEQGGQVARHIYGHAGVRLLFGDWIGGYISDRELEKDLGQLDEVIAGLSENKLLPESIAEIASDYAARDVVDALRTAGSVCDNWDQINLREFRLRENLRAILCR